MDKTDKACHGTYGNEDQSNFEGRGTRARWIETSSGNSVLFDWPERFKFEPGNKLTPVRKLHR